MKGLAGAVLVLLWTSRGFAQQIDGAGVPFRTWDANTSVGLHVTEPVDAGAPHPVDVNYGKDATAGFGIDIGRYWTSHLKTEAGIQLRPDWTAYSSENVRLPDGQVVNAFRRTDISLTQLSAAATWQFLDNTYAHPYVSAGARIGIARAHGVREERGWVYDGRQSISYAVERDESRAVNVIVRPFLAGGFKCYFTERVFTRPEVSAAWREGGTSQLTFRLGFGLDF